MVVFKVRSKLGFINQSVKNNESRTFYQNVNIASAADDLTVMSIISNN